MNSLAKLDELKWIKNVCERCTLNDFDNFSCSIWSFFSCLSSSLIKSFSNFLMSILEFSQPLSKILILYLLMTFVWLARGQLLHFTAKLLILWRIANISLRPNLRDCHLAIDQWKITAVESKLNWNNWVIILVKSTSLKLSSNHFLSTSFICFKFFWMKEIVKQNKLNKDVTQQKCSTKMTQIQIIKLHKFPFLWTW